MRRQTNLPALNCIQHNTSKKVVTEQDVIAANKNGFGSKIGGITNKITSITSLMANYSKDSEEYKILKYRTQCGQALQQEEIDKAKGIIPTKMPLTWHQYGANRIKDDDSDEIKAQKELNKRICAHKKPYFFIYNYDHEYADYNKFSEEVNSKAQNLFGKTLKELSECKNLSESEQKFLNYCNFKCPVDMSPSTMNRICWKVEEHFASDISVSDEEFDYTVYKSIDNRQVSNYIEIKSICDRYISDIKEFSKKKARNEEEKKILVEAKKKISENFKEDVIIACTDEVALCNILLDLCYSGKISKSVVWDVSGDVIVRNLLEKHSNTLTYPVKDNNGDFLCCGYNFSNRTIEIGGVACD